MQRCPQTQYWDTSSKMCSNNNKYFLMSTHLIHRKIPQTDLPNEWYSFFFCAIRSETVYNVLFFLLKRRSIRPKKTLCCGFNPW